MRLAMYAALGGREALLSDFENGIHAALKKKK
jgi:hypothetical protein